MLDNTTIKWLIESRKIRQSGSQNERKDNQIGRKQENKDNVMQ